jgi:hypothetical protein
MVELPSKPHSGSCSSVGNASNSLICVFPRRFGIGVYPSSQIYSSLYFVIELSHKLMMRKWEPKPNGTHACTRPPSANPYQAFNVPIGVAGTRGRRGEIAPAFRPLIAFGVRQRRAGHRPGEGQARPAQAQTAPDYTAVRAPLIAPIKTAPFARNILPENPTRPATLAIAQALASRRLLLQVQKQKCLQFTHGMILFWSCCTSGVHGRYGFQ